MLESIIINNSPPPIAPTSNAAEAATPGSGRGGVGGGAPTRYTITDRGRHSLNPWSDSSLLYCVIVLNTGTNPLSRIEVVSLLNILKIGKEMLHYNYANSLERYYPKVYLGTSQTIARNWNMDLQNIEKYPEIWPEKKPQKGENNL